MRKYCKNVRIMLFILLGRPSIKEVVISNEFVAEVAVTSFAEFTVEKMSPDKYAAEELTCLADYIMAWLESGEGVRATQGKYQTFLIAVVEIIEAWLSDPGILFYITDADPVTNERETIERAVSRIYKNTRFSRLAFDEHYYDLHAHRALRA